MPLTPSSSSQATDTNFSSFILFIGDFVPELVYYLTFAFVFISFAVSLPFFVFLFYFCCLRISGQPYREDEHHKEIPL